MNTEVNNILHILVRDEKTWLSMAEEITSNSKIPAKDLLHDFYIALHSKIDSKKVKINDILYNDSLNKAFIYKMMHNIFIDTVRVDKDLLIDKDLKNIIEADNTKYVDIEKVVDDIVNEFYWFDRKLFNLYRKKFHSIRKLSAATNISHVVVWRTINNCIKEIKKRLMKTEYLIKKVGEEVIDLLLEKNAAYGDTANNPSNIFSKLDSTEAIKVRIDDKLSRIKNKGLNDKTEDTLTDLIGYLVLLKISYIKNEK